MHRGSIVQHVAISQWLELAGKDLEAIFFPLFHFAHVSHLISLGFLHIPCGICRLLNILKRLGMNGRVGRDTFVKEARVGSSLDLGHGHLGGRTVRAVRGLGKDRAAS